LVKDDPLYLKFWAKLTPFLRKHDINVQAWDVIRYTVHNSHGGMRPRSIFALITYIANEKMQEKIKLTLTLTLLLTLTLNPQSTKLQSEIN